MALTRKDLEAKLGSLENKEDVINYIMSENGKSINELRAKNEELTTQLMDKEETIKGFGDYEEIKKQNEELSKTVNGYKEKESNGKFYTALTELGFDKEFVDESIFSKIPKNEDMEAFKKSASEFLEKKPMYAAENYEKKENLFDYQGNKKFDIDKASDDDTLAYLKGLRNPKK